MLFGEALTALQKGEAQGIRRSNKKVVKLHNSTIEGAESYLYLENEDKRIIWTPQMSDLLSNNWELYYDTSIQINNVISELNLIGKSILIDESYKKFKNTLDHLVELI